MDVIIVSKTHMNNDKCCVGGITSKGEAIRLLTFECENQPNNTEMEPKQIWEIDFFKLGNPKPPHIEDVIVVRKKLKNKIQDNLKLVDILKNGNILIWNGNPDNLFDNKLKWTNNGSGYIDKENIPDQSVGFWISDKNLTKSIYFNKPRYNYKYIDGWKSLPYVGFDEAIDIIPAGTLIRVSLARWWNTNGTTETRCSLQLSGWYDVNL